jgi:hypothetical protein
MSRRPKNAFRVSSGIRFLPHFTNVSSRVPHAARDDAPIIGEGIGVRHRYHDSRFSPIHVVARAMCTLT